MWESVLFYLIPSLKKIMRSFDDVLCSFTWTQQQWIKRTMDSCHFEKSITSDIYTDIASWLDANCTLIKLLSTSRFRTLWQHFSMTSFFFQRHQLIWVKPCEALTLLLYNMLCAQIFKAHNECISCPHPTKFSTARPWFQKTAPTKPWAD